MNIFKNFEIRFYVSLKFAQHVITSLFSQHLSFVSSWIKLKFYLEFYYALPCIRLNGVLHLFHLFVYIFLFQCNQDYFHEKFTLGVCLHACGVATDMVLKQCIENEAQFVICPCCYGGIQDTHFITYPRSQHFKNVGIEYKVGTAFWIQLQSLFLVNLFMYW